MIKDGGGRRATERGAPLKVWEGYFKEPLNRDGKQRRAGATVLCGGESGVGGDHRRGSVDGIEEDEEGKSTRH